MKKAIVIGGGISGLCVSYFLKNKFELLLLEQNNYIGGHSHTHTISENNKVFNFDSGFIVFNNLNYQNYIKVLEENNVEYEKSNMSFSVINDEENYEWAGKNIKTIFDLSNIFTLRYWKVLAGIVKLNLIIKTKKQTNNSITVDQFLRNHHFNDEFINLYFLPMCSSIWSSNFQDIKNYGAKFVIKFFENHGLCNILKKRPIWMTIKNGSSQYVKKIVSKIGENNCLLNSEVINIDQDNKIVKCSNDKEYKYDILILCIHTDQAKKIIKNLTKNQEKLLDMVNYKTNNIVIHSDEKIMPNKLRNWSSWNYRYQSKNLILTYWMNLLQNLPTNKNYFVTVNPFKEPKNIINQTTFEHPIFSMDTLNAQKKVMQIQGLNNTYFCGSYLGYGFHEDGIQSAVYISQLLGCELPWKRDKNFYNRIEINN